MAHALRNRALPKTVQQAVRDAADAFQAAGVPEAKLSAQYIMASCFGAPKATLQVLHRHSHETLSSSVWDKYVAKCARRFNREPIQYIVGEWDFASINLLLRPPVLIPRPETEELVQHVVDTISSLKSPTVLDIGTGSGAIALAVLHACPSATATAVDISPIAVQLTTDNAKRLGLHDRIRVVQSSLQDFLDACTPTFDCLVSNPPYIPSHEMAELDAEVQFEDPKALDGGPRDGLDLIRDILHRAPRAVKPGGSVWLETHLTQPDLLARSTHVPPHLQFVRSHQDVFGKPRFCHFSVL